MSQFKAFFNKELLKVIRNYSLVVILIVFAIFGVTNPILAKLTPQLMQMAGLNITLPESTALDSWIQFYKNITTQLVIFVIVFGSIFTTEIKSGSLINIITRGMPRSQIITAKFSFVTLVWSLAYFCGFIGTYFYTPLLLTGELNNLLIASFFPYIFGILILSVSFFGAVVTQNTIGSLVVPLVFTIIIQFLSIIEAIKDYLPGFLLSNSIGLLTDSINQASFIAPTLISVVLTFIFIISSILVFNKQHI